MVCFKCVKINGKSYYARKTICGCCREVLKVDLVDVMLGSVPIYLTEKNRNKKGRPPKLSCSEKSSLKYKYKYKGIGATSLAREYKVSRDTVYRIVNDDRIG